MLKTSLFTALLLASVSLYAQERAVKTTFQTSGQWKPVTDVRADAVMVYGVNDNRRHPFAERMQSWRERGYETHFMTGIAWGQYQDYFTGRWDGQWHLDEGQKTMRGDTIWHGRMVPYIVPTKNYLKYFKECHIKPVIDAGISHIFLEEPEFWARGGYSEAFKREWQDFYGFPWRPQHESAENTYLSNKLKYHLYYRALDEAFTYAKEYGRQKGIDVKCYVPTHSLLNYSQWQIVSPEASLASMPSCDGYIAQVWTGTSREPNYYNGVAKERVFETAFLEYGCMESMIRPTNRKVFFLTDPIEDRAKDWEDYKRNYEATFTAQLLFPQQNNFEVMPWPDRIFEGLYRKSATSDERARIPRFYSTQMLVMINTLNNMPTTDNKVSGSQGISVLMANSLMFQRSPQPVEGYDDPQLSNFYGLALPLVKHGIPVGITHLENTGYADTWKDVKVLMMSYSNMKPMSPDGHRNIAQWVSEGGKLIYCGRDDDAFQNVLEWWNQDGKAYRAPANHLFELMQIAADAPEGEYDYGKGKVFIIRKDPKEFVLKANGHKELISTLKRAYDELNRKDGFTLQRGPYLLAANLTAEDNENHSSFFQAMQPNDFFIDLYDPSLPVLKKKELLAGQQTMLYCLTNTNVNVMQPQVLAAASRQYNEQTTTRGKHGSYSFVSKSPAETTNAMRILLPREPKQMDVSEAFTSSWDEPSHTLFLSFENNPDGVAVNIKW